MQAIRLVTPRQLEIADIAEPQPGPEDVLVEVHFVGMCGSDLNAYRGTFPLMRYPRILGHEASGIVVARGAAVPPEKIIFSFSFDRSSLPLLASSQARKLSQIVGMPPAFVQASCSSSV